VKTEQSIQGRQVRALCDADDDDDDEYDNFHGAITQHMPLQGRLDKKPSHVRDMISRSSVFLVWT